MLLILPYTEYLGRLSEPRNIADVILVFLLVYAVLKLVRGTRAAPMAAAIGAFALLYWLAVKLDAELSYDLLVSIFNPESPLHDGAVVVRRHRVAAASCFLPLTLNPRLSRDLGTRHRAALGVTEDTDAVAVVVSEESGLISIVQRGEIKRGLDAPRLRAAISEALEVSPKREKVKHQGNQNESDTETEEVASI